MQGDGKSDQIEELQRTHRMSAIHCHPKVFGDGVDAPNGDAFRHHDHGLRQIAR